LSTPITIGEHRADQFPTDGYWPYNSLQCFYEPLPDDHAFYTFGAFGVRHLIDFLTGTTTWLREAPVNDIEKAADRAVEQIRLGLDNGFHAELLTHEQKLGVVALDEWERILARAREKLRRYETIASNHDAIGAYLRSRDESRLAAVQGAGSAAAPPAGGTHVVMVGRATCPLRLSVYTDADNGIARHYQEVPAFADRIEMDV
jgi:hypothetical protein